MKTGYLLATGSDENQPQVDERDMRKMMMMMMEVWHGSGEQRKQ